MKCSMCNRVLQPGDELKWECNSCHQFCRANLQMLEQIQAQRENGYTAAMVNCPFCGTVLDDGNETIHWDCIACGNRTTGTIKNYVRPEMFVEEEKSEAEDTSSQSEFSWFDSNGEAMDAPPEEPPSKQKSFFANEEEKNEFLAETKSQALGEEIPDSIFEDVPIRKPRSTAAASSGHKKDSIESNPTNSNSVSPAPAAPTRGNPADATTLGDNLASVASPGGKTAGDSSARVASSAVMQEDNNPVSAVSGAVPAGSNSTGAVSPGYTSSGVSPQGAVSTGGTSKVSPFVEPPTEPIKPMTNSNFVPSGAASPGGNPVNTVSSGNGQTSAISSGAATRSNWTNGATSVGGGQSGVTSGVTTAGGSSTNMVSSNIASSGGGGTTTVSSDNTTASDHAEGSPASDSSMPELSRYEPPEPPSKQALPKILTGILSVVIVAAIIVGGFFIVRFFMAPTRQFRSAVQKADYTKASEIYDNKIKGDTDEEKIAKIAVEHFLHERYDAFRNGSGSEDAYKQILEFAQNKMGMVTSDYEPDNEPEETPEPTATPDPVESPAVEESEAPSETPEVTAEPEATSEATMEPEATPEATLEPTPESTEIPEEPVEDPQPAGTEDDITAVIQKANKYVKKNKFEKAYNHLAKFKDADTTGQIKKEMASVKKDWKSYNIKTFKALCAKLSIVYYASEKRYHIVPRGYYTNYNQISRSNNVGGIAYMDQQKKKVSITNIGKDGALSSFGKTNRANLKQFKEMIEKYPYLAKEIK